MDYLAIFLALTPVFLLIILLGFLKVPGDKSALYTLIVTILLAALGFNFSTSSIGLSIVFGTLKAIFPIILIIIMAIYSYNVLVFTKKMEVLKFQFSNISTDKTIQVLLLTWGFGGLLEGMAGFGTAVAIPAAILIGLGYKPLFSALVSLLSNSVPTAFGAVGIPVKAIAIEIGHSDLQSLGSEVVFQLIPLMVIIPFIIVFLTDSSLKSLPKNIALSLVVGIVSIAVQYYSVIYIGIETPAVLGSIASIIVIVIWAKIATKKDDNAALERKSTKEIINAWAVYGLILFFIIGTSPLLGSFRGFLQSIAATPIHLTIEGVEKTVKIFWLTDGGVLLFLGSVIGGLLQGAKFKELMEVLWKSILQLKKTYITVTSLIVLSTIMDLSGMIVVLGTAIATATGAFYPLFAPAIGCLGAFLTGSDTSSNILFGKLQAHVANQIGGEPSWFAAANTVGATGGKIISPQSIAIATSACNQQGKEGEIMKKALPYAILYIIVAGLMVYFFGK
ncbi:lactate permease [Flavobacterium fluvii]|uniref:L-lactate permease n=1 Tax=Flavobacterium fluvii TaxID=468056 RepID=A0A1M5EPR5_9FLAO|nr:lactate permease LctP family transporter [Flavobacterium fluvii]SHF81134.1 lactate permease [Flavobacterium fluvii]